MLKFCLLTEVTQSSEPRSQSLVTLEVHADHRYTQGPRPTASTFNADLLFLQKNNQAIENSRHAQEKKKARR